MTQCTGRLHVGLYVVHVCGLPAGLAWEVRALLARQGRMTGCALIACWAVWHACALKPGWAACSPWAWDARVWTAHSACMGRTCTACPSGTCDGHACSSFKP